MNVNCRQHHILISLTGQALPANGTETNSSVVKTLSATDNCGQVTNVIVQGVGVVGPQGERGRPGPVGAVGPIGPAGLTGQTGPPGVAGIEINCACRGIYV